MIRRLVGLFVMLAALAALPPPAQAANLAYCTGSGGSNPCPDPLIASTYNALVGAVNAGVTASSMGNVANFRNLLDNPKFDVYPISSGTAYTGSTITATLTGIAQTCTYHAGRWCTYANNASASAQVAWVNAPGLGFQTGYQFGRTSANANLTQICLVQEVSSDRVIELQGQNLLLSFYALAGANFSAASSNLQLYVNTGTLADNGIVTLIGFAPTTINSWAGAANQINGTTQAITTTLTRYQINAGAVPATAQSLAVQICYTPVGTAGAADYAQVTGVQLEVGLGGSVAAGGVTTTASPFEFRPLAWDLAQVGRFAQAFVDGAATRRYTTGVATGTSLGSFALELPVTMRSVPTMVGSASAIFGATNGNGIASSCTSLALVASSNTVNTVGLNCVVAGTPFTLGQGSIMVGGATTNSFLLYSEY